MNPDFVVGERMEPSEALASNRAAIRHVVESHRARNARVGALLGFGQKLLASRDASGAASQAELRQPCRLTETEYDQA